MLPGSILYNLIENAIELDDLKKQFMLTDSEVARKIDEPDEKVKAFLSLNWRNNIDSVTYLDYDRISYKLGVLFHELEEEKYKESKSTKSSITLKSLINMVKELNEVKERYGITYSYISAKTGIKYNKISSFFAINPDKEKGEFPNEEKYPEYEKIGEKISELFEKVKDSGGYKLMTDKDFSEIYRVLMNEFPMKANAIKELARKYDSENSWSDKYYKIGEFIEERRKLLCKLETEWSVNMQILDRGLIQHCCFYTGEYDDEILNYYEFWEKIISKILRWKETGIPDPLTEKYYLEHYYYEDYKEYIIYDEDDENDYDKEEYYVEFDTDEYGDKFTLLHNTDESCTYLYDDHKVEYTPYFSEKDFDYLQNECRRLRAEIDKLTSEVYMELETHFSKLKTQIDNLTSDTHIDLKTCSDEFYKKYEKITRKKIDERTVTHLNNSFTAEQQKALLSVYFEKCIDDEGYLLPEHFGSGVQLAFYLSEYNENVLVTPSSLYEISQLFSFEIKSDSEYKLKFDFSEYLQNDGAFYPKIFFSSENSNIFYAISEIRRWMPSNGQSEYKLGTAADKTEMYDTVYEFISNHKRVFLNIDSREGEYIEKIVQKLDKLPTAVKDAAAEVLEEKCKFDFPKTEEEKEHFQAVHEYFDVKSNYELAEEISKCGKSEIYRVVYDICKESKGSIKFSYKLADYVYKLIRLKSKDWDLRCFLSNYYFNDSTPFCLDMQLDMILNNIEREIRKEKYFCY